MMSQLNHLIFRLFKSLLWRLGVYNFFYGFLWRIMYNDKNFSFIHYKIQDCFTGLSTAFEDPALSERFKQENEKWSKQEEFVVKVTGNIFMEPVTGMGVYGRNKVVGFTKYRFHTIFPGFRQFIVHRFLGKYRPVEEELDSAVFFDSYLGKSYFHFYFNVLGSFWLLYDKGFVNREIPVLIGRDVYYTPHFQFVLRNTFLSEFNWKIIPHNAWLKVHTLYIGRNVFQRKAWDPTIKCLNKSHALPERKVFLNRSPKHSKGRTIKNLHEIYPVLEKYGFEVVDTAIMSIEDQQKLFSEVKYLIGIHGAGLTNIIFSDFNNLNILEIYPNDRIYSHYYWLAGLLGINYDGLIGTSLDKKLRFKVPSDILEYKIQKMLG